MRIILRNPKFDVAHKNLDVVVKRVQISPNSQSGCERSISKSVKFKNQYSSTMSVLVMNARQRCGENGPPLHLFAEKCAPQMVQAWTQNRHRLAKKVKDLAINQSKVIKKIRNRQAKKFTSKIFW
jgi:hypothetical protein